MLDSLTLQAIHWKLKHCGYHPKPAFRFINKQFQIPVITTKALSSQKLQIRANAIENVNLLTSPTASSNVCQFSEYCLVETAERYVTVFLVNIWKYENWIWKRDTLVDFSFKWVLPIPATGRTAPSIPMPQFLLIVLGKYVLFCTKHTLPVGVVTPFSKPKKLLSITTCHFTWIFILNSY